MGLRLGIDFGTSGVRAAALDDAGAVAAEFQLPLPAGAEIAGRPTQAAEDWWCGLVGCVGGLLSRLAAAGRRSSDIAGIAVDGTSGTMLLADKDLRPLTPALMYNSRGFDAEASLVAARAPAGSLVQGAGSALSRLLFLLAGTPGGAAGLCLHQADWIASRLVGKGGLSDANNALKLGFDPLRMAWPDWLVGWVGGGILPEVFLPGERIGGLAAAPARELGLAEGLPVHAGTTDSVAAFLASGADRLGDAVTSLGSTIALKLLSQDPVSDPASGVYSHRLGAYWLPGGASNAGGAALLQHFTIAEIEALTPLLDPDRPTGLAYYPLPARGERFPVNDPDLLPVTDPRPESRAAFLQGLLEGLTEVEVAGYRRLGQLGAPAPRRIFATGGGARNAAWRRLREVRLGVPFGEPRHANAACGTARLAGGPGYWTNG